MYYYIQNGDERRGPFHLEELKSQNITENTLVWNKGLYQWTKACEVLELVDLFRQSDKKSVGELMTDSGK